MNAHRISLAAWIASLACGPAALPWVSAEAQSVRREGPVSLVFESGVMWKATGDRYPDDEAFVSVAGGVLWDYDDAAAIGLVARTGFGLARKKSSPCPGSYPCVIEGDSWLPLALEARFTRSFEGFATSVGAGPILEYGGSGFATHVGLHLNSIATLAVHGDLYERDWHWLVTAGLEGKAGVVGLGAILLLRTFTGFAEG